jgi:Transposase DDE domain group 1
LLDEGARKRLFVSVFLKAHATSPKRIIFDLDATDDPIHGDQEGRFFQGYYKGILLSAALYLLRP